MACRPNDVADQSQSFTKLRNVGTPSRSSTPTPASVHGMEEPDEFEVNTRRQLHQYVNRFWRYLNSLDLLRINHPCAFHIDQEHIQSKVSWTQPKDAQQHKADIASQKSVYPFIQSSANTQYEINDMNAVHVSPYQTASPASLAYPTGIGVKSDGDFAVPAKFVRPYKLFSSSLLCMPKHASFSSAATKEAYAMHASTQSESSSHSSRKRHSSLRISKTRANFRTLFKTISHSRARHCDLAFTLPPRAVSTSSDDEIDDEYVDDIQELNNGTDLKQHSEYREADIPCVLPNSLNDLTTILPLGLCPSDTVLSENGDFLLSSRAPFPSLPHISNALISTTDAQGKPLSRIMRLYTHISDSCIFSRVVTSVAVKDLDNDELFDAITFIQRSNFTQSDFGSSFDFPNLAHHNESEINIAGPNSGALQLSNEMTSSAESQQGSLLSPLSSADCRELCSAASEISNGSTFLSYDIDKQAESSVLGELLLLQSILSAQLADNERNRSLLSSSIGDEACFQIRASKWRSKVECCYRYVTAWQRLCSAMADGVRDHLLPPAMLCVNAMRYNYAWNDFDVMYRKSRSAKDIKILNTNWIGRTDELAALMESESLELEDYSTCAICNRSVYTDDDMMIYCKICNVSTHRKCYGITKYLPDEDNWVCQHCLAFPDKALRKHRKLLAIPVPVQGTPYQAGSGLYGNIPTQSAAYAKHYLPTLPRHECQLCPYNGGIVKRTDANGWAHVFCGLWLPCTTIENPETVEPITGVSEQLARTLHTICSVCRIQHGACVSCSHKGCAYAFHATCAWYSGLDMRVEQCDHDFHFFVFCPHHMPLELLGFPAGQQPKDILLWDTRSKVRLAQQRELRYRARMDLRRRKPRRRQPLQENVGRTGVVDHDKKPKLVVKLHDIYEEGRCAVCFLTNDEASAFREFEEEHAQIMDIRTARRKIFKSFAAQLLNPHPFENRRVKNSFEQQTSSSSVTSAPSVEQLHESIKSAVFSLENMHRRFVLLAPTTRMLHQRQCPTNMLLRCSKCGIEVHQYCYGVSDADIGSLLQQNTQRKLKRTKCLLSFDLLEDSEDDDDVPWQCKRCAELDVAITVPCALCPRTGGAFCKTMEGLWCHVACAISFWPDLCVRDKIKVNHVGGVSKLLEMRGNQRCYICRKCGPCVKCSNAECSAEFHPLCNLRNGGVSLTYKINLHDDDAMELLIYCKRHTPLPLRRFSPLDTDHMRLLLFKHDLEAVQQLTERLIERERLKAYVHGSFFDVQAKSWNELKRQFRSLLKPGGSQPKPPLINGPSMSSIRRKSKKAAIFTVPSASASDVGISASSAVKHSPALTATMNLSKAATNIPPVPFVGLKKSERLNTAKNITDDSMNLEDVSKIQRQEPGKCVVNDRLSLPVGVLSTSTLLQSPALSTLSSERVPSLETSSTNSNNLIINGTRKVANRSPHFLIAPNVVRHNDVLPSEYPLSMPQETAYSDLPRDNSGKSSHASALGSYSKIKDCHASESSQSNCILYNVNDASPTQSGQNTAVSVSSLWNSLSEANHGDKPDRLNSQKKRKLHRSRETNPDLLAPVSRRQIRSREVSPDPSCLVKRHKKGNQSEYSLRQ